MERAVYRGLKVWQRAMDLVVGVHVLVRRFPPDERYGLASQLRRAAASVPANIAEGNGRIHRGEYLHHLAIARGSLLELDTHLELARRLDYVKEEDLATVHDLQDQISRMLNTLMTRMRR